VKTSSLRPRVSEKDILLLVSFILFFGPRLVAADADENAAAILSRAAAAVDLQAPGSAPFLMMAKINLSETGKSVEGLYAIAWAAPGKFRRVFRIPNFTSTEVADEGAIYRQRSTDGLPLLIWEASELLAPHSQYRSDSAWNIRRVHRERVGAVDLNCVIASGDITESKMCVDAATGAPYSVDHGLVNSNFTLGHEHFEFADYQPFEGRMFPRKLTFWGWGPYSIEVHVEKLLRPAQFPADEFTPPKEAVRLPYCDSPVTVGEVRPSAKGTIPFGFRDVRVSMYFQVSPAGGVQYAQVVDSSDPVHSKEILNWFVGTHFPVKSCAGSAIPYETIITLVTGH
jgi:hypothetical protein